ncbi:hypothetical protein CAPTEDRAFT_227027 [Capitella teleta]|uniref:Craniofacial development protein 1 n=1 Tax=Capitella teleta TaxID=283909 RepID=R7UAS2_CAPTE|nr:hypothetical protein CAPTEDRAFT_227027 [Capitella teleta]|eukprot:ELU03236.1 hypothetical protein CAPTEDRAFT_227027 [Capitella teleta]
MASFNDDDFDSDTSDDDYVPVEGEVLSEEENSGEDEEKIFREENEDASGTKKGKKKKKKSKAEAAAPTLRKGGIKLDGEEVEKKEVFNSELAEAIQAENREKKAVEEKKKADSLWADFMKDAGPSNKPKPKIGTGLGSLSSAVQKSAPAKAINEVKAIPPPQVAKKVTITQEFDFAGETVKVTKEVDANSKEAASAAAVKVSDDSSSSGSSGTGVKRPAGGLGSLLGKIGKKPKIGTLEKSKLDWESFKSKEGISEELQIHNRGKSGYLERMDFLSRTDQKQFEIERNIRLGSSSKR